MPSPSAPCIPMVIPIPGVTNLSTQLEVFAVDPGLAVDPVHAKALAHIS
jgi:hypothetical protein